MIMGTGLTQTTKVTFGGVAATTFKVNTDSQVTANVPAGAVTGKIVIKTKGGSAASKNRISRSRSSSNAGMRYEAAFGRLFLVQKGFVAAPLGWMVYETRP